MLDRLITFALKQRVFMLALALALAIAGGYAWRNLPVEAFPDVQDVQVQIITQVPGQAPEEVERAVTLPIEREMSGVPRMSQLRSVSITGLSVVTLTFSDHTDDYFARQQVLEKLQNVNLPPNVQAALAPLSNAVGEIYRYVIIAPPDMPLTEVRALQDWTLKPALRRTPGVADIVSFGGLVKEYQVKVNPFCCASTRSRSTSSLRRWRTTAPMPAAAYCGAATKRWSYAASVSSRASRTSGVLWWRRAMASPSRSAIWRAWKPAGVRARAWSHSTTAKTSCRRSCR